MSTMDRQVAVTVAITANDADDEAGLTKQGYGEFADHTSQQYHYRPKHLTYVDQHHQYGYPHNRRHSFIPASAMDESTFAYAQPMKSANQLAWERHNYYQRLQDEEEQQALRIRQERLRHQQYHVQQLSHQRQVHQESSGSGSSVARTGSLNRLSSPPLLSTETSRLLGLCRSNTISAAVKRFSLKKDKDSSSGSRASSRTASRPCSPSSVAEEHEDDSSSTNHRNGDDISMSGTTLPSLLTRKKTLKDHLTPSFRSLARHCSQRFSNGRPQSFAGPKSDPILQQQDYSLGRHSLEFRPSDHMSDFKPLQAGPETSEILKQQQDLMMSSQQDQKVPVHRKVTLFRSMSTRVSSSVSMTRGVMENLSKRNSLRLANGRGMDFSCEEKTAATPSLSERSEESSPQPQPQQQQQQQQQEEEEEEEQQQQPPTPTITASEILESSDVDEEEHESMRKQISAILALGRKDTRRRRSLGSRASTPTPCLSPLAVEAQEYFTDSMTRDEESEGDDDDDDEPAEEGTTPFCDLPTVTMETGLKDPCEHIAFMLVPKSRYEFQPLVVQ
ncbi:hypothetical protein BGX31_007655 [Mortierella sp. GBA43]|nr:hypothetical protein BGX31_007655 [Mortierella sp. GBA43]